MSKTNVLEKLLRYNVTDEELLDNIKSILNESDFEFKKLIFLTINIINK